MTARLESGEVLLTTRMSHVFQSLGHAVLAGNAALRQRHDEGVAVQSRHLRALSEAQAGASSVNCELTTLASAKRRAA